jgi:hypothetical protein
MDVSALRLNPSHRAGFAFAEFPSITIVVITLWHERKFLRSLHKTILKKIGSSSV